VGGVKLKKILLLIYLAPFLFNIPVGLAYNDTVSMPVGWYLLFVPQNIKIGDTVLACAPANKYSMQGIRRGYIGRVINGNCIDDTKYLVKKVASTPFDDVILTPAGIEVNGRLSRYKVISYLYYKNRSGKYKETIKHYPFGKYIVNGYFLISTRKKLSYDSRYYGPVKKIAYKAEFLGKHIL
jgi:conjugative transfer signal peptidase TraF